MDDLYRELILEHYKQPHNWGELDDADLEFEDFNPLCGDELKVQIKVDEDERISAVRFSGHGCAISQASASMASDEVIGMPVSNLLQLDRDFVLDLLGIGFALTVWGASQVELPAMKLAPPIWENPDPKALAPDLGFHLVYGVAVATAYKVLS